MDYRDELIIATKKGIGFPCAGLIMITYASIIVHLLPMKQALMSIFIATGSVFPIALLISKLIKVNPFIKLPPLSNLGAILAGLQVLYWPVFIFVFNTASAWVPFTMSVLFGSHFIPYGWLYKSRAYYFIGFAMPSVGCILALLGEALSYQYTFAMLIPIYAVTCALLFLENKSTKELVVQPNKTY